MRVVVVGGGVVGVSCALELARRGAQVVLREAEPRLGLAASGTNSGILHTGFDSTPGELETELILRAAVLRPALLAALDIPFVGCGAVLRATDDAGRATVARLADGAARNGVAVVAAADGAELVVPGEGMTDPVAYVGAIAAEAVRHGAVLETATAVRAPVEDADVVVNAAGLGAGRVARLHGDDSFDVRPRKGEFLVFDLAPPERILLPVPTAQTKGVLVFGTLDGRTVAGPTVLDIDDEDWSVRPQALDELRGKAEAMEPRLRGAHPVFAYAGLRPAGRDGANYVVRASIVAPRVVHAAAIRSTGLTAAPAIAERVAMLAGLEDAPAPLIGGPPLSPADTAWWRRSAEHRGLA